MSACATLVIRCVLSMDAFCERLKEFNPQLKIERESSNKYMPYLNFHTQEAMKFTSHKALVRGVPQIREEPCSSRTSDELTFLR